MKYPVGTQVRVAQVAAGTYNAEGELMATMQKGRQVLLNRHGTVTKGSIAGFPDVQHVDFDGRDIVVFDCELELCCPGDSDC